VELYVEYPYRTIRRYGPNHIVTPQVTVLPIEHKIALEMLLRPIPFMFNSPRLNLLEI
jgi:hypothetical protein